jgi:hypothetical protein
MVCSFGALKLCERHPVNGYTFLASYYAIGTYSVLGAKPILGCISRFGRFTGTPRDYLRDLISDIFPSIFPLPPRGAAEPRLSALAGVTTGRPRTSAVSRQRRRAANVNLNLGFEHFKKRIV